MHKYRVWCARKAYTGCREVLGPAWGWEGRVGVGLGAPDFRRVCVICRMLYFMLVILGFRRGGREDLTFLGCGGGVGRRSRVGGRDWAWWSGKALELVYFGVALQRYIAFCV